MQDEDKARAKRKRAADKRQSRMHSDPAYKNKIRTRQRELYREKTEHRMLLRARCRAKRKGWDFNLTIEDVAIPARCPVLGIPLAVNQGYGASAGSPSLDRIDSSRGYVKGNVAVVSHRANNLKGDGTVAEMRLVAKYMEANGCT